MAGPAKPASTTTPLPPDHGAFGGLHRFFQSGTWLAIETSLLTLAVLIWLGGAYWVYKDAHRRIRKRQLVATAVAGALLAPVCGPLLYLLFRPAECLESRRERALQIKTLEDNLQRTARCSSCRASLDRSFRVCPFCTTKLRETCEQCGAALEARWQLCPYCETPVAPGVARGRAL